MYSPGSNLRVIALPFVASGKSVVSTQNLSYTWKRNGDAVPEQSGKGRNVLTFEGDQLLDSERVEVTVLSGGVAVGRADITIPEVNPQVLLYDKDPLRGELTERALPAQFTLNTNEITLQAEPYYFSKSSVASDKLGYSWTLNGQDTAGPQSAQGLLTLRQTGQGAGSAVVSVSLQNNEESRFFQQAKQALQITFGQTGGNALSSFLGI